MQLCTDLVYQQIEHKTTKNSTDFAQSKHRFLQLNAGFPETWKVLGAIKPASLSHLYVTFMSVTWCVYVAFGINARVR